MPTPAPFHIYRSSAGSGKTRTLAREYILLALQHQDYFRYILAVSFANKSAQEMKDRIIKYLGGFAKGESSDLADEIRDTLGISETALQEKSAHVLSSILHDYSQFSISTIDAFFQRVIRAFTREAGLLGNFRLEVENDRVLGEVIEALIDELGPKRQELTDWVVQFSRERLLEGENWNITAALKKFSNEIFKEEYIAIADQIAAVQKELPLNKMLVSLRAEKKLYTDTLKAYAREAVKLLNDNDIGVDDFKGRDKGTVFKYFTFHARGEKVEITKTMEKSESDSSEWVNAKSMKRGKLHQLAEQTLRPLFNKMREHERANEIRFRSATIVEKNFYSYGLIADINRKLREYRADNNVMLLSDASHFLNGVINDSDTPFVYEKVGSFYRHYLIDEFQDTSGFQWRNFKPLFSESLYQNYRSIIVGDVKQSIYRWRGGDLGLLQSTAESEIGSENTQHFRLGENWRSAENLVTFNNLLFTTASKFVSEATGHPLPANAFFDVVQEAVKFKGHGLVRIQFIENWKTRQDESGEKEALQRIPRILEELQQSGIAPGEITILVRKNSEGQDIADFLMRYKNSPDAVEGVRYEVVSNESLRLDAASSVLLLLNALRYLVNPDDAVARGQLVYEFGNWQAPPTPQESETLFTNAGNKQLRGLLPDEFLRSAPWLVKLSLFELTETLIRIFGLGDEGRELSYLQSFQDVVLEFGGKDKNDIESFLEWWEEIKDKRSIQVAENTNAVNIFTIHKAKGLQFKYVIVPFCSWPMNHTIPPLLWARSDESPFDQLGYVAVRYEDALKKSFFAKDYEEEFARTYLDNLNVLYVALTRAEEGMILMAPLHKDKGYEREKISDVGELLLSAITATPELSKYYNAQTFTFTTGAIEKLIDREKDARYLPVSLDQYLSVDWRSRLVIRREGREFFREEKTLQRARINYGILAHRVLSEIHYRNQVSEILQKLNFEGIITETDLPELQSKIEAMMKHPVISTWFGKEWQVRTESPVIIPGGNIARIDRVITKDVVVKGQTKKKAVIIDYKTGAKNEADRAQIQSYTSLLSSMGYVDVDGYLLYLDDLDVIKVIDKSSLSLF